MGDCTTAPTFFAVDRDFNISRSRCNFLDQEVDFDRYKSGYKFWSRLRYPLPHQHIGLDERALLSIAGNFL